MSRLRTLVAGLALLTVVACDSSPSTPDIDPVFAKGGGGGGGNAPIKVKATDPTGAPQDTTLDVRVLGSGFDPDAHAAFLLAGSPAPGVVTNSTLFVSEEELIAEITVALDADIALYDVEVSSFGRRRGIGTELFSVFQKGGGGPTGVQSMRVQIPSEVRMGTVNTFEPDGLGVYDHEVCGVLAGYAFSPPDVDRFQFYPKENGLNKKNERDLERACGDNFPRSALIRLDLAVVHLGGGASGHRDDVLLPAYGGADLITPDDQNLHHTAAGDFALLGPGGSSLQNRGFTLRYCLDDGKGPPMRFGREGTNLIEVSRSGDVITVRTQPYPDNIAGCEHGRDDGSVPLLLLHIDIAYTIEPLPVG